MALLEAADHAIFLLLGAVILAKLYAVRRNVWKNHRMMFVAGAIVGASFIFGGMIDGIFPSIPHGVAESFQLYLLLVSWGAITAYLVPRTRPATTAAFLLEMTAAGGLAILIFGAAGAPLASIIALAGLAYFNSFYTEISGNLSAGAVISNLAIAVWMLEIYAWPAQRPAYASWFHIIRGTLYLIAAIIYFSEFRRDVMQSHMQRNAVRTAFRI